MQQLAVIAAGADLWRCMAAVTVSTRAKPESLEIENAEVGMQLAGIAARRPHLALHRGGHSFHASEVKKSEFENAQVGMLLAVIAVAPTSGAASRRSQFPRERSQEV